LRVRGEVIEPTPTASTSQTVAVVNALAQRLSRMPVGHRIRATGRVPVWDLRLAAEPLRSVRPGGMVAGQANAIAVDTSNY
jgi:hypothetical protein